MSVSSGGGPRTSPKGASNLGRKSSFAGGFKHLDRQESKQLPLCPKGNVVDYESVGPCRRRKSKSRSRRKTSRSGRKQMFRVPLKREDGNMEQQIVEYNCEFPNRVVVRMEYLMQSTKVRLNDRLYMDEFYMKLLEEEKRSMERASKAREKAELTRMKKLIIDGVYSEIPAELSYLHRHPVFRVNKMLARLQTYDASVVLSNVDEEDEITPVEPYEFDGNHFFKHLHDEGVVWMPEAFYEYEKEKLEGKIYRAKLRLLIKRKEQEAEDRAMRIISEAESPSVDTQTLLAKDDEAYKRISNASLEPRQSFSVRLLLEEEAREQSEEEHTNALQASYQAISEASMQANKLRGKMRQQILAYHEKIKQSKELQEKRDAMLDLKRHELEKDFVDTYDYDYHRIITNYAEREKRKHVSAIFHGEGDEDEKTTEVAPSTEKQAGKRKTDKPFEELFETRTQSQLQLTEKSTEDLFERLKNYYEIPPKQSFNQFETFEDMIISHMDTLEEGEEMMEYAQEVVNMCTREQIEAKHHLQRTHQEIELEIPEPLPIENKRKSRKDRRSYMSGSSMMSIRSGMSDKSDNVEGPGRLNEQFANSDKPEGMTQMLPSNERSSTASQTIEMNARGSQTPEIDEKPARNREQFATSDKPRGMSKFVPRDRRPSQNSVDEEKTARAGQKAAKTKQSPGPSQKSEKNEKPAKTVSSASPSRQSVPNDKSSKGVKSAAPSQNSGAKNEESAKRAKSTGSRKNSAKNEESAKALKSGGPSRTSGSKEEHAGPSRNSVKDEESAK